MKELKRLKKDRYKLLHLRGNGEDKIELVVDLEDGERRFEYTPEVGYSDLDYEEIFDDAIQIWEKLEDNLENN